MEGSQPPRSASSVSYRHSRVQGEPRSGLRTKKTKRTQAPSHAANSGENGEKMHRDGGIRTATGEYNARVLGEQTETLTGHPIQRFVWLRRLIGVRASAAASFGGRLGWAGDILLDSGGHVWLCLRWRVTELMFLEARDTSCTDVHGALGSEERESKSVGSRDGCLDRRGPWAALFTRTYPIRMQLQFPFIPEGGLLVHTLCRRNPPSMSLALYSRLTPLSP
jgi:hypothetical protein